MSKWNPLFWFGNKDDPEPPADKWPDDPQWLRRLKWYLRNPLHNFTWYVIGVADKKLLVLGDYPGHVFSPAGGWKSHRVYMLDPAKEHPSIIGGGLPFWSYIGPRLKFYVGWRQIGNFGLKLTHNKEAR